MYAVIETGGRQYRVQLGQVFQVEKLDGEIGTEIKLDKVLFFAKNSDQSDSNPSQIWLGKPYLPGAAVQTQVVGQGRGEKLLIVKMKRRKGYRKTQGHRQYYTQLLVTTIDNGAGEKTILSAEDKNKKLSTWQSHLKAWGEQPQPKQKVWHDQPQSKEKKAEVKAAAPKAAAPEKKAHAKPAAKKTAAKKK
jgi:large subunit ribosomal protein L21